MGSDIKRDLVGKIVFGVDDYGQWGFIGVVVGLAIIIAIVLSAILRKSLRFNAANITTTSLCLAFIVYFVTLVVLTEMRLPPNIHHDGAVKLFLLSLLYDPVL